MKWGIKHQVLLLTLVPTLTISILLGAYFTSSRLHDLKESFLKKGETLALQIAPSGEYGVFSRNKLLLQDIANEAFNDPHVQSVAFYTANGENLLNVGKSSFKLQLSENSKLASVNQVITLEDPVAAAFIKPVVTYKETDNYTDTTQIEHVIGWLKLELETDSLHLQEYQILIHAVLILLLCLAISGLFAFKMGRSVTQPILELADCVEKIRNGGELLQPIKLPKYTELKILANGINTMSLALKEANTEMQNKVNQATFSLRRTLETIEVQNVELEMARKSAESANKVKSEFLADMSHEIRTPLNGVVGFIHLLQKTQLTEKQQEYMQTVQRSANNLLSIINDILDFSKIEAGKLQIESTPMDIQECVEETIKLLAPYAREKNIKIAPYYHPNVPRGFLGDQLRIKQIITNLVNNAIKFTEQGSVVVHVKLNSDSPKNTSVEISVTDTGIGLSEQDQKALFQAFNQVKIGTSRKFGGTGLGLVICKKLVEQMGGEIGVESKLGEGSTFWFTFPIQQYTLHAGPLTKKTLPTTTKKFDRHLNILAVDDNPDNLRLITILLEEMGINVTGKTSGQEAIQAVHDQLFELILMDIRMSNMNGLEAAQAIRRREADENHAKVPIIALTAHALESEKNALLAAGIDDYLAKPVMESDLRKMIEKWTTEQPQENLIDWELGKKLAGGNLKLAEELLTKLIASLPEDKTLLIDDYEKADWKKMRDHAHKLHGACCYCGIPELKRRVHELETTIAKEETQLIESKLNALIQTIDAVILKAGEKKD